MFVFFNTNSVHASSFPTKTAHRDANLYLSLHHEYHDKKFSPVLFRNCLYTGNPKTSS